MNAPHATTEYRVIRDTFRCLAEEALGATSEDQFFPELARRLGFILGVRAVIIGELADADAPSYEFLARWSVETSIPPLPTRLDQTAAGDIYREGRKCVERDAQQRYPDDPFLRLLKAKSFFGEALYDSAGRPIGHICVIDDKPMAHPEEVGDSIHIFAARAAAQVERIRADRRLRATTVRLAHLISSIDTAVLMEDQDGKIILANPRFCSLFAPHATPHKLEGIDGSAFIEFMKSSVASPDAFVDRVLEILHRRQPLAGELLHMADGRIFERDFIPITVDDTYLGHVWQFHDITGRVHFERELARARDLAIEGSQAKSSFLTTMSHEIRTPMHGVIGMARLLINTPLTPEQREYVDTIRRCGDDLLSLIDDILDLSKIEAGGLSLENIPFDLVSCVESALDLLAARASEKGLELWCDLDPACPPSVVGDQTRIRQILFNLLSNAVKFTQSGEIIVRLDARRASPAPGQPADVAYFDFHFQVKDTGIGIPTDKMDRLFKPFSQVDSSTTRKYGGTGLGLAICLHVCQLMGGRIWAESVPGRGSNFQFTVRLPSVARSTPAPSPQDPLRGMRVLIVAKNPTALAVLQRQLNAWCISSQIAPDLPTAMVSVADGARFDTLVWDVASTDLPSLESDSTLLPNFKLATVVLHPPHPALELARIERSVACAMLPKPLHIASLKRAIQNTLHGRSRCSRPTHTQGLIDPTVARRHPLRILLVEDNRVNQKVSLQTLGKMGYAADVAENGEEVLRAIERQPYDLIFMDVQMPIMDGLETTHRIRNLQPPPAVSPRIVAMTAYATAEDRKRCLDAGMDDYISKPLRLERLYDVLGVSSRRQSTQVADQQDPGHDTDPKISD